MGLSRCFIDLKITILEKNQIISRKKRKIRKKMDTAKMISKERPRWKCREHPNVSGELICLNGDTKERIMCFNCA